MSTPTSIRTGCSGEEDLLLAVEDVFNFTFSEEEAARPFDDCFQKSTKSRKEREIGSRAVRRTAHW